MFISDSSQTNKNFSLQYLRVIAFGVMIVAAVIFLYFFFRYNFRIHYMAAVSCLFLLFCGILMWLFAYIALTEKTAELTFEKTSRQIKHLGWYSIGAFYGSGLCFYAGMILFAQKGDVWRYSIILFAGAIVGMILFTQGFIQRKIAKQHYELKKQQQQLIDLLENLSLKEKKDISGGALLA